MNQQDHTKFHNLVKSIIGEYLFYSNDNSGIFPKITLSEMILSKRRVAIFYDNINYKQNLFMNSQMISHWPQSTNAKDLFRKLDKYLHQDGRPIPNDNYNPMYVSQCVMTENAKVIVQRPFSGLRNWEEHAVKT